MNSMILDAKRTELDLDDRWGDVDSLSRSKVGRNRKWPFQDLLKLI